MTRQQPGLLRRLLSLQRIEVHTRLSSRPTRKRIPRERCCGGWCKGILWPPDYDHGVAVKIGVIVLTSPRPVQSLPASGETAIRRRRLRSAVPPKRPQPAGPRNPGSAETRSQTIEGVQRPSQETLRRFCRNADRVLLIDHLPEGSNKALSLAQMLTSTFGPILGFHSGAHICVFDAHGCVYRPYRWLRPGCSAIPFCSSRKIPVRRAADAGVRASKVRLTRRQAGPARHRKRPRRASAPANGTAHRVPDRASLSRERPALQPEPQSHRIHDRPLFVQIGGRELAELDAHLLERVPKQLEPSNCRRRILADLPQALDGEGLLLDARFHPANMHQRGIRIGVHCFAPNML